VKELLQAYENSGFLETPPAGADAPPVAGHVAAVVYLLAGGSSGRDDAP
jgi:hypothetical protein